MRGNGSGFGIRILTVGDDLDKNFILSAFYFD